MNYKGYYTESICERIYNSIDNPQWRIWKIKESDGRCIQSRLPINSPKRLRKFIQKSTNPCALYYSISEFLNAHKNHGFFKNQKTVYKNKCYSYPYVGYLVADCVLLNSSYFIDLDHPDDLRVVQSDGRELLSHLGKPSFIRFSGTKGIHISYHQRIPFVHDPFQKITLLKEQKKMFVNLINSFKLKTLDNVHRNIICDPFRVIAAPHSIKEGGGIVTDITFKDFMEKDIYSILSKSTTRLLGKKASEAKANDIQVATERKLSTQPYQAHGRAGLSSEPLYFKFVDNMVSGLKNTYIPIIKKHNSRFKEEDMGRIQQEKNLSDMVIYRVGNYTYAVSTKINDFDGTLKILKKSKSENLRFFSTRKHTPIPLSGEYTADGIVVNRIERLGVIKSKNKKSYTHSKPHSDIFGLSYNTMVGDKNRLATMQVS